MSRSVRLAGAAGGVSPCRRWATVSGSARGAPRALFEVGQLTDLLRVKRSDLEPRATIRHRRPPIANRDLLPFRVDLISARPGAVVKPVPAVLARPITAHLRQPRPHLRGRRVDRQGHRPAPLGPRDQIGARERRAKLLISGAPAAKASPDETAIHADQQPDGYQREASFRVASRCGGREGGLLCHDSHPRRPNAKYESGPRKLIRQSRRQRVFGPRMRAADRR